MNLGITRNLTETGHSGIRIRKKNRKRSAKKRKKKKPKENQKEIGLVVLSALFLETRWVCLRLLGFACDSGVMRKCQMNLQK